MENDSFIFVFICVYLSPLIIFIAYLTFFVLRRLRLKFSYKDTKFRCITGLIFMKYCKLPKDRDFFKRTLYDTGSILPTVLPKIDMNDYDFTNVSISNCIFTKKTKLPKDPEFFQKIKDKDLYDCTLPNGDYSLYNFKGVNLNGVVFPKKSKIPLTHSFFSDLGNAYVVRLSPPKSFKKTCHLYDLSRVTLYTHRDIKITEEQKTFIRLKNNGELYPFIKDSTDKKIKQMNRRKRRKHFIRKIFKRKVVKENQVVF